MPRSSCAEVYRNLPNDRKRRRARVEHTHQRCWRARGPRVVELVLASIISVPAVEWITSTWSVMEQVIIQGSCSKNEVDPEESLRPRRGLPKNRPSRYGVTAGRRGGLPATMSSTSPLLGNCPAGGRIPHYAQGAWGGGISHEPPPLVAPVPRNSMLL